MICYVAGITTIVWLPVLPSPLFVVVFLLPLLGTRLLHPGIIAFFLGAAWSLCWGHWQLEHRLYSDPIKADWHVQGTVLGLPEQRDKQVRFTLSVDVIQAHEDARVLSSAPRIIRLNWYRPSVKLESGMALELVVRLKPPHGLSNPDGFDYELWLLANGIDATGYVRNMLSIKPPRSCRVDCMRGRLLSHLKIRYEDSAVQALIAAITLGVRDGFSAEQWQLLRATGTIHLAVISGLHIGFAALVGMALVGFAVRRLPISHPRLFTAGAGITCALCYMLIAGSGLPTQRAFLMVAIFLIAQWRLWHVDLWSRWWAAMALVLSLLPIATHQAGFWLSFLAVATLLWFSTQRLKDLLGWRAQLGIFCTMTPVLVFLFGGLSLISPFINILAIPLMGLVLIVTALDLIISFFGVDWTVILVNFLGQLFWRLIEVGGILQQDIWRLPQLSVWAVLLAACGGCLWVQPIGFPLRWLGWVMWLPLLTGVSGQRPERSFDAWVFDVGQGLSVLVNVGEKRLLYDAGPAFPNGASTFDSAVSPYLEAQGATHIDKLVLSHNDLDHTGGYASLISLASIGEGLTGSPELVKRLSFGGCLAGDRWRWGGVQFSVLSGSEGNSDNNRSCVLLINDDHCALLLTGDIDSQKERELVPASSDLTWLVASHHGSKTGTSDDFLHRWLPESVIYSTGFVNRFRHPSVEVQARVKRSGAGSLNTASHGAIHLVSGLNSGCTEAPWRNTKRRFWSGY